MSGIHHHPRLHQIFQELQERGLISHRRRLVECPFTPSIRGCPTLNSIRYRRAFYERTLSRASDDTLRFVLLHEEGHIRRGSSQTSALLVLPVLLYLLLLRNPLSDVPLSSGILPPLQAAAGGSLTLKVTSVALLLLVTALSYRAYYRQMYTEEFTADRYAAEVMRRCYQIRDPGTLLQNLFSDLKGGMAASRCPPHDGLARVFPGLLRAEHDYRPSISERVQRISEAVGAMGGRRAGGSVAAPGEANPAADHLVLSRPR